MNFPTSPTLNQTYSLGDKTWKWNGVAWDLQSTGLTSSHVVAALGFTPLNKAGDTITGTLAFSGTGLRITGDFSNATLASRLMFQTSTTNGNTGVYVIPNGTSQISTLRLANNSDPTNAGHIQIQANSNEASVTAGISGSGTYLPLAFSVGGSERGRFDIAGNFGIGTNSPGKKLDVVGDIRATTNGGANIVYSSSDTQSVFRLERSTDTADFTLTTGLAQLRTNTAIPLILTTNGTEKVRIEAGGNFGVGTSAPKVRAQFSAGSAQNAPTLGSALGIAYFTNNDAGYGLLVGNSSATGAAWLQAQRTDGTATAYDIVLNPVGGNLGLGVTPSAWGGVFKGLDIAAMGGVGGSNTASFIGSNLYHNGTNWIYKTTATASLFYQNAGQHQWYTAGSGTAGNVISLTQAMTLDASSNLTATGNVTAYSDERLKKDWSALPSDFIERLAGVKNGTYTRIDNGQRQIGVGAQSLQPVAPDGVLEGEHLSVAYGNVALAAAVELAKRVVRLEAQINALIGD